MFRPLIVEPLGDLLAIDGVAPGKMFGYQSAFIGLQGTNEMPYQSRM